MILLYLFVVPFQKAVLTLIITSDSVKCSSDIESYTFCSLKKRIILERFYNLVLAYIIKSRSSLFKTRCMSQFVYLFCFLIGNKGSICNERHLKFICEKCLRWTPLYCVYVFILNTGFLVNRNWSFLVYM